MRWPYNGERQIVLPPPIQLGQITPNEESLTADVEFRVQVPDSRLQVKVSVLFVPDSISFPFDITSLAATYLLQEEDESYGAGFSGYIPLTTIVGDPTTGNPLALPEFPGLMGYSREFVTAADAVHGHLHYGNAILGKWVLQTRYQPAGQRLPDPDWQETLQLCNATLISAPGNL